MDKEERIRTIGDILTVQGEPTSRGGAPTDAVAVQEWDGRRLLSTTYAELLREADGFAAVLAEDGIRPRDHVAILMPNGKPWVAAYMAVQRLGAVAVPLGHEHLQGGAEHIAFALGHSEAGVIVVGPEDIEAAAALARDSGARVVVHRPSGGGAPLVRPDVGPDEVAQILYTSGTTGRRKGVSLTHANVLFNVRASIRRFGFREGDCLPALLPCHHAYPLTTSVIAPLYAGARVPVGDVRSRQTADLLRAARPTVLIGVPRMFESLLHAARSAARREGKLEAMDRLVRLSARLKSWTGLNAGRALFRALHRRVFGGMQLRFCMSGGARLSPSLARQYFALGIPLLQGWGMTELSPVAAAQPFSKWKFIFTRHYERQVGSIGLPLDGTGVRLVDVPGQNVYADRDGRGEMVAGGPHVMAGYYKDPEATERALCEHGLRSGDIARRDRLGHLHIIGRAKHVIVLPGGKKVFPEEDLYDALRGCKSIEDFTVCAITDAGGEEKIGIIVKPDAELVQRRGLTVMKELYGLIKAEITVALREKPGYMKSFDFCLTERSGGAFRELAKSGMKEACPLKNEFRFETAYSTNRDSREPLGLRPQQ